MVFHKIKIKNQILRHFSSVKIYLYLNFCQCFMCSYFQYKRKSHWHLISNDMFRREFPREEGSRRTYNGPILVEEWKRKEEIVLKRNMIDRWLRNENHPVVLIFKKHCVKQLCNIIFILSQDCINFSRLEWLLSFQDFRTI